MTDLNLPAVSPFRRGLRYFGPNNNNSYLFFIHDLQSWTTKRLLEFFNQELPNCNEIIQSVVKKYSPNLGIYFILRVDGSNKNLALSTVHLLYDKLHISSEIKWKECNSTRSSRFYNRSTFADSFKKPLPSDFFSNHLNPESTCFNLCASWNVNGWNTEKKDGVLYFISTFKPACLCFQEIGNSQFLCETKNSSPYLTNYKSIHRRYNPNVPGMRGLYIGIHKSCTFSPDPISFKYIISVNVFSFWNQKCSIGNIYFPQSRWKEARTIALQELNQWLSSHNSDNHPAILVGDFNMPLEKIRKYISNHFPDWSVAESRNKQFTWAKGKHSSCIDHIVFNRAMETHINMTSTCSSFYDVSDHNPIILSCKKDPSDVFKKPSKVFKWSKHICNTKSSSILSHNYFSVLDDELSKNVNNLSADDMVQKFIDSSNAIGKDIKALIPTTQHTPGFHCPYYIRKLSHEKHLAYMNIKPLSNCENIDKYLEQFTLYNKLCLTIKRIKSKFRSNKYKANVISMGKLFVDKNYRLGWCKLKKISNPSSASSPNTVIKNSIGQDLFTHSDQLRRWAEHYKNLASDVTGHSLDRYYWNAIFPHANLTPWNINEPISLSEIRSIILSMKNNKAPGPDGIPIEFYKAIFSDMENESNITNAQHCLEIIFNKIWDGSFPRNWNSAAIVSIPKKGDLSDCNNYRGISLINVGLKILSKIVTDRISKYAFSHNFIRPEQFGFRNREECISLFISIRDICQRRKFANKFTYVAFLDLKKAYDSVPIFNILTKLYNLGIRGKCFDFLSNLYLTSKARARLLDMLSEEFPIKRGVRQGCPLSPILFNLFINDVLDGCDKYGVKIGDKKCCGGLFADDIVLIAPTAKKLQKLLRRVLHWANINEMSFGIAKCATMVIKPLNFRKTPDYEDPTFYFNMHSLPKVSCYTYLGIPFSDDLSLQPILSNMYTKVNKSLNSFRGFLTNNTIPIPFKKMVLQSFIISKVLYYAPLLGSNKKRTSRVQSLVHKGILWCIGSSSKDKNNKPKDKVNNSYISLYALTRDLQIPPLAATCAAQQIKCFKKWKSSNCIIKDLIKFIPPMSHYSWTKESKSLSKKLVKRNLKNVKEVKEDYWKNSPLNNGIKALRYTNNKFSDTKCLFRLSYDKPQLNLGINWILRIRAGYEKTTRIAIASNRVTDDCPRQCPCCDIGKQSFQHWILECSKFSQLRSKYLYFINDLFNLFLNKYHSLYIFYLTSDQEIIDKINNYIFTFLLGGTLAFNELHIDDGERRHLKEQLYGSSGSSVPYILSLAQFLTESMPIISSSMELLFDRFSKTPNVTRSVDVVPIRHRNNHIPYTGSNSAVNSLDSWESLVDTTLS